LTENNLTKIADYSQEVWKDIPDILGYQVSDLGRVRSFWKTGAKGKLTPNPVKILRHNIMYKGYHEVRLPRNNKYHHVRVHRLVLTAFIGPCPTGLEGCHNDGDTHHNYLLNLRWDTPTNNHQDKLYHGTHRSKLTEQKVKQIRLLYSKGGCTMNSLANMFSIAQSQIHKIISYQNWKHV
jgi:hypothetical protein